MGSISNVVAPPDEAPKPEFAVRPLTYAWDQTDEEVKIYISFDQRPELNSGVTEAHVNVEYGDWNLQVVIDDPTTSGEKPFGLRLADFQWRIDPDHSRHVLRSSRL